jgi:hypothetical protein
VLTSLLARKPNPNPRVERYRSSPTSDAAPSPPGSRVLCFAFVGVMPLLAHSILPLWLPSGLISYYPPLIPCLILLSHFLLLHPLPTRARRTNALPLFVPLISPAIFWATRARRRHPTYVRILPFTHPTLTGTLPQLSPSSLARS